MSILHGTTKTDKDANVTAGLKANKLSPVPALRVGATDPTKHPQPAEPPRAQCIDAPALRVVPPPVNEPRATPDPRVPENTLCTADDATVVTNNCTAPPNPWTSRHTPHVTRSMNKPHWSPHHATVLSDPMQDTALHGNAFNPDTGELAEYKELCKISDGALWQSANATKIHQLTQGHGDTPGTNTMFFIPVTAMPQHKKATYLCIVCTH